MFYKNYSGTMKAIEADNYRLMSFNMLSRAVKLIESNLAFSLRLFSIYGELFYSGMVQKELKMANLKPGSKILHIGSGAVPYTAFYLSKKGYFVKGIDNDRRAVLIARNLLDSLGASRMTEIGTMEGLDADMGGFNAVWVSLHVKNKELIIKKLKKNMASGCVIVCREPRNWLKLLYNESNDCLQSKGFIYKRCPNRLGKQSIAILKI